MLKKSYKAKIKLVAGKWIISETPVQKYYRIFNGFTILLLDDFLLQ
jgi:hypothetical protein